MVGKNELVRQMGNARFFITRSTKSFEKCRLAGKLLGTRDIRFEEKKFGWVNSKMIGVGGWYLGSMLHRRDGPARDYVGNKEWYFEGKRHRTGGPAIELNDGTKIWYFEGKLHREDGPAAVYPDGTKEWWVNGERMK